MQLVKYWTNVGLQIEFFDFRYCMTAGSTDVRRAIFARRRIARIENLLGKDLVNLAKEEACAEFGKEQDPRVWAIFLDGTEEERKELQAEIAREMQEARSTGNDKNPPSREADTFDVPKLDTECDGSVGTSLAILPPGRGEEDDEIG